jgi:hypothetical protein
MEERNLASDPLRLHRRLLFVGLAVLTILFGAVVFFKSVLLKRPQGDLGCFCRAGWAIREGGAPLYHVICNTGWHYNYPPAFAILMVPLADPPRRDLALTAGVVTALSASPGGNGPLLASTAAAANPVPVHTTGPNYLPFPVSVVVFYLCSLALLSIAVHLLARTLESVHPLPEDPAAAWRRFWSWRLGPILVCSPVIGLTLVRGQVQTLLLLMLTGLFISLFRGRRLSAGLCIGAAACLKLFPGFLVVLPFWRRDIRCLAGAALGVVVGLVVLPVVVLGPRMTETVYRDYAEFTIFPALGVGDSDSRSSELINATATQSQAFQVIMHKTAHIHMLIPPPRPAGWMKACHWLIGAVLTLATLLFLSRHWGDALAMMAGVGMLSLVMVLLSPVCHLHYFTVGVPVVIALSARFSLEGSRAVRIGMWSLFLAIAASWSLPMIPGLHILRNVGVPMYGALTLWLAGWVTCWQVAVQEPAATTEPQELAA